MGDSIDADYLVVGAGAVGMAFTDALVDHSDARVAVVDRRHATGGHWLAAYPFVRLHQSSSFYGVASTQLGNGELQRSGPERGLHERASQAEICAYYGRVADRLSATGRVQFHTSSEYVDGAVVSRVSGKRQKVPERTRAVNAHYLAPGIPAELPPPFAVDEGVVTIPVNELPGLAGAPSQYVVVGSGKTATDACVWLLSHGVDPDAVCWVRPREPWMLNRARVQPDPAIFLGMVADLLASAGDAQTPDDLFLRLEEADIMLRIDTGVTPTMARAPTLARWELDLLRTIGNVVRRGHLRRVSPGRLSFDGSAVRVADDAVVVHCAADGLRHPPLVPIWGADAIRPQPVRAGFPCFGAALAGYVEATRDDDAEKNRLCPPSNYGNTLSDWARMNVRGIRATQSFGAEPDIRAWSHQVALNPARILPERAGSPEVQDALARLDRHVAAGVARLAEWA